MGSIVMLLMYRKEEPTVIRAIMPCYITSTLGYSGPSFLGGALFSLFLDLTILRLRLGTRRELLVFRGSIRKMGMSPSCFTYRLMYSDLLTEVYNFFIDVRGFDNLSLLLS